MDFYQSELKGIVRVHINFPCAPSAGEHNFKPGTIRLLRRKYSFQGNEFSLNEAVVDIDRSCLSLCDGLFSTELQKELRAMLGQEHQLSEWKVEAINEEFCHTVALQPPQPPQPIQPIQPIQSLNSRRLCDRCGAEYQVGSSVRMPYPILLAYMYTEFHIFIRLDIVCQSLVGLV